MFKDKKLEIRKLFDWLIAISAISIKKFSIKTYLWINPWIHLANISNVAISNFLDIWYIYKGNQRAFFISSSQ